MKKVIILGLLPLAMAVSGCLSPQEQLREDKRNARNECKDYGFKFGTPEYAQCIERGVVRTQDKREAAIDELVEALVPTSYCTNYNYGFARTYKC